jgi:hypothetical protein
MQIGAYGAHEFVEIPPRRRLNVSLHALPLSGPLTRAEWSRILWAGWFVLGIDT